MFSSSVPALAAIGAAGTRARSTTISRRCALPALRADRHVLQGLRRTANKGGFEAAFAEIQDDYERSPTPENKAHLDTLQTAITTMFSALEAGFANRADWNFRHTVEYKIAHFLSGFDGIFTLNQDLLFERHYHDLDLALNQPKKWFGRT
jgi:hypothetical protein